MKSMFFSLVATLLMITAPAKAQSWEFDPDLFDNVKWYSYDMTTHFIWSNLDVFIVQADGALYTFQVLGYYDPRNPNISALYTIRVQKAGGPLQTITVNASACGNSFNNPDYDACINDPSRNTFTYLNLATGSSKSMSEVDAQVSNDWDIAFKNTTVILNNGSYGPKNNAAALAWRDAELFKLTGPAFLKTLQQKSFGDMNLGAFNNVAAQAAKASAQ
jgi:hypothetical protein